jgi:hypothetical protein
LITALHSGATIWSISVRRWASSLFMHGHINPKERVMESQG